MIPETTTPTRPLTGRAVKNARRLCANAHILDLTRLRRSGLFADPPGKTWTSLFGYPPFTESSIVYFLLANESGPVGVGLADYQPGSDFTKMVRAYGVPLSSTPCYFGGHRFWFLCPLNLGGGTCLRRCRILYRPPGAIHFGCRDCHRLTYECNKRHRQAFYEEFARPFAAMERFERKRQARPGTLSYRDVLRAERAMDELLVSMERSKDEKQKADVVR